MKPIAADEMFPEGIDIEDVSIQLIHNKLILIVYNYFSEPQLWDYAWFGSEREGCSCGLLQWYENETIKKIIGCNSTEFNIKTFFLDFDDLFDEDNL